MRWCRQQWSYESIAEFRRFAGRENAPAPGSSASPSSTLPHTHVCCNERGCVVYSLLRGCLCVLVTNSQ